MADQKSEWRPVSNAAGNVVGHQTDGGRFVPGSSAPHGDGPHYNEQQRDPDFERFKQSRNEAGN